MKKYSGTIVAAGGLLIAAAAAAQRNAHDDVSANLAAASPTMSAEGRQAMQGRIEAVNAKFRAAHGGLSPEQFGLQCCQITQIPTASFSPRGSLDNWEHAGSNYVRRPSASAAAILWAPVSLPTGVEIEYLDLYYIDYHFGADISASLWRSYGGGPFSGTPGVASLATTQSSGDSGYGYASASLTYTVDNNVSFDSNAGQLHVEVTSIPTGLNEGLAFRGVDLWWMRQVSPPPATATFTDVPTSHPFFRFVEALAAAGITAGYGDGRYGVNDPITRGQMAVFLSKALGLYWPG